MRALIKLLLCFFFGFLFYFLGGSALLFRHVTLWWPVYIRVQKCISRAEPSAPQKHTNAAQLSSELAKKYECNKETKERTSLTFVSLSLLLRYRLQSSDWRWRVRGAVVGIHSGLSRVARTTIAFEAMGRFYFFFNAIAAHEICVRCRNCMPVDGVPYMSFGEHYSYDSYTLWWQEVSLH